MSKRLLKLFWTLVGFAALNVAFAIFTNPRAHPPLPATLPVSVPREYSLHQAKTNTRAQENTHTRAATKVK